MTTNNYHCLVCQQVKPPPDPKTTSKCPFCNHINPKIQLITCGKCKERYKSCCLEKEGSVIKDDVGARIFTSKNPSNISDLDKFKKKCLVCNGIIIYR
jgi:hypothetical protein